MISHCIPPHTPQPSTHTTTHTSTTTQTSPPTPQGKDCKPSVANLVLTGHTDNAEFALGTCLTAPYVASGGKDKNVCVWNLDDVITGLAGSGGRGASGGGASGDAEGVGDGEKKEGEDGGAAAPTLAAQCVLQGHTDVVEDVCFSPENHYELARLVSCGWFLWDDDVWLCVAMHHRNNLLYITTYCISQPIVYHTQCIPCITTMFPQPPFSQNHPPKKQCRR